MLDPRPDAAVLYSGCTPGKRHAWVLPDDRHTASLVGLRGGWMHARMKFVSRIWIQVCSCQGKGLVLPTLTIDKISTYTRFLILSIPDNEMSRKSLFAVLRAIQGMGGEPKSVKKLRSGDLLVGTASALQTKSFLLAKTFLYFSLTLSPHKYLYSRCGVISEPDRLTIPEAEILDGFSDQGVIQFRKITIKQDSTVIPSKHLMLTFNNPNYIQQLKPDTSTVRFTHTIRILYAALSARSLDIPKLPAADN
ncbi:uncharacterized protein TNCV_4698551 [Trichonephila clavipes]|nr:uncharacterized protein TNCV_4698551 [Trichonephila clavipes]